jgi:precorrin isomerase
MRSELIEYATKHSRLNTLAEHLHRRCIMARGKFAAVNAFDLFLT